MPSALRPLENLAARGDRHGQAGPPPDPSPCRPQDRPLGLRGSSRVAYAADWGLFTDWGAAAGHVALPASVDTLIEFLDECPACLPAW